MGADIHSWVEVKKNNKWERVEDEIFQTYGGMTSEPFSTRDYSVFGFIADVRNISGCVPICEPRGLPEDSEYLNAKAKDEPFGYGHDDRIWTNRDEISDMEYHGRGWLSLKELLEFDYSNQFKNRRYYQPYFNKDGVEKGGDGGAQLPEGQGSLITYREHVGEWFFDQLNIMGQLTDNPEDVRVIFMFDN